METNLLSKQGKGLTAGLALICIILAFIIFFKINSIQQNSSIIEIKQEVTTEEVQKTKVEVDEYIYVFVCGQVKKPGVYKLPKNTITAHAVEYAGGFTENADWDKINLAKSLKNEDKIKIPQKQLNPPTQNTKFTQEEENENFQEIPLSLDKHLVNINTADQKTIESIPGIGTKTAEKIIAYRENSGWFKSFEELQNIPGLKKKTLEKCRKYIFIE